MNCLYTDLHNAAVLIGFNLLNLCEIKLVARGFWKKRCRSEAEERSRGCSPKGVTLGSLLVARKASGGCELGRLVGWLSASPKLVFRRLGTCTTDSCSLYSANHKSASPRLSGCVFISRILRTVAQSEFIGVGMSAFYGKVIDFYRFVIFSLFVMIIFALSSRSEPNPYLMWIDVYKRNRTQTKTYFCGNIGGWILACRLSSGSGSDCGGAIDGCGAIAAGAADQA